MRKHSIDINIDTTSALSRGLTKWRWKGVRILCLLVCLFSWDVRLFRMRNLALSYCDSERDTSNEPFNCSVFATCGQWRNYVKVNFDVSLIVNYDLMENFVRILRNFWDGAEMMIFVLIWIRGKNLFAIWKIENFRRMKEAFYSQINLVDN